MRLNQLRDFIAIADHGSLRAAARQLDASAPALVKSIALLEKELQVPLLVRGSRGMRLTEYGHALLQRARLIDAETRKAKETIEQLRGNLEGSVTVGASATPGVVLVPEALVELHKTLPAVRINIVSGIYRNHIDAIRSGRMDFAITATPADGIDPDVVSEDLFRNDLVVAGRRGHPLAKARSLAELVDCGWVVTGPDPEGPGAAILEAFRRHGLKAPRVAAQCDLGWVLDSVLLKTDLLCALPRLFFDRLDLKSRLQPIEIDEPLPSYCISLIRSAAAPLLPSAERFETLLRRHAAYLTQAHAELALGAKPAPGAKRLGKRRVSSHE
ncbi:MAG TPA: LysR substrate-binding domain-containing protein [Burkholderiaceae bacterium]|nr:LysR substrate-binding domain-containing protein [Burkholderiaceae bacterium]